MKVIKINKNINKIDHMIKLKNLTMMKKILYDYYMSNKYNLINKFF